MTPAPESAWERARREFRASEEYWTTDEFLAGWLARGNADARIVLDSFLDSEPALSLESSIRSLDPASRPESGRGES